MKNNILYVGEDITNPSSGMQYVNWRNIELLKKVYNKSFYIYPVKGNGTISTLLNSLTGHLGGISNNICNNIIKSIEINNIETIFLSSSRLGKLSSVIKKNKPNVKIITFFHNIEKDYSNEEYRVNPTFRNWYLKQIITYNEQLILKYSDYNIVLNQRDNKRLFELYNKKSDLILPITFEDKYNETKKKESKKEKTELQLLFVGSAFFANIEGINWFIKEVFPNLNNCKLTIVGKGMNKHYKTNERMDVYGYVDELDTFYYNTDIVISPIFSGSGMKTKTAEALMYGCPIIGTEEAFEGYNINDEKIGGCIKNAKEMIKKIKDFQESKILINQCSSYAREVFIKEFSMKKSVSIYRNWINK